MERQINNSISSAAITLGVKPETILLFLEQMREYEKNGNKDNVLVQHSEFKRVWDDRNKLFQNHSELLDENSNLKCKISQLNNRLKLYERENG